MNKNKNLRNLIMLKVVPFLMSLGLAIGIGYIVNIIPFVQDLNKSDTAAVVVAVAVVAAFIFYGVIYKAIIKIDSARADKAIEARLMLGHRVVQADIKDAKEAKAYVTRKEAEMKQAQAEHNAAVRTLKHFESKAKHINEIKSV